VEECVKGNVLKGITKIGPMLSRRGGSSDCKLSKYLGRWGKGKVGESVQRRVVMYQRAFSLSLRKGERRRRQPSITARQ